jgi:hypothetical protein
MVAEREGFEPPVRLRVLRISSAARSTTLPPLLEDDGERRKPRRMVGAPLSMTGFLSQGGLAARQAAEVSESDLAVGSNRLHGDMGHQRHGLAHLPGELRIRRVAVE